MKKKLTLRMEEDVIERAKQYAKERGTSVSKLVANYFSALTATGSTEAPKDEEQYGPVTRSLGAEPKDDVSEEDYYEHLWRKHR